MSNYVVSGPLFDGRMEKAIADACGDSEKAIAVMGAAMVRAELNTVLRVQTPVYRFKVRAQKGRPGWEIWDQGVIYGHWLEGTGSRNKTTRFKGYSTFRRMTQKIQALASRTAHDVVVRYVGKMN